MSHRGDTEHTRERVFGSQEALIDSTGNTNNAEWDSPLNDRQHNNTAPVPHYGNSDQQSYANHNLSVIREGEASVGTEYAPRNTEVDALQEELKSTNDRLDNAQSSLQTLQWQLKYATDRLQLLSEERRRLEMRSDTLMEEKQALEGERDQLLKQSQQGGSQRLIENLTKKGERLRAERDMLKSKERKRMIFFVTTTIEFLAYCVAVGCVVKKASSWGVTSEVSDYVSNAISSWAH
eukprot:CAMPEP_0185723684 /NCGR_PEP_ID=MMETSP1171-20130828/440_1 /TAXON_ID=374046 /ORGANISM="Helicotheca tamensis, Strain CCMP826" /LENGTH=235 /DNA_ID=CAMNT_0028391423 /DNA_START=161 /DNA_END=868 /DNA_ORIENTATION=+